MAGDPATHDNGLQGVMCDVSARNPRQALYDARSDAKDLLWSLGHNPDGPVGLTEADMARLRGAGRSCDITREEVATIRARWDAKRHHLHLEREAEADRLDVAAARSKAEAERRAVEEGWVLGPGETLLSRLNDLKSAEYAAARRGTPMFADRWEREMAWLREVVLATAEGRAPNRPRHEPHEDRQWW